MAVGSGMSSGKAEFRALIMIKAPLSPFSRVMAKDASGPQAAKMVLILVTAHALARYILERTGPVTGPALYPGMAADKRKACQVMIEKHILPPFAFIVAALTAIAQLALVRVILFVAGDAAGTQFNPEWVRLVAGLAFYLPVRSAQREFGIAGMVEVHPFPLCRCVAGPAFGTKAALMHILQVMTGEACRAQILVMFAGMAALAGNLPVRSCQPEFGLAVVKWLGRTPARFAVACRTVFAKAAFMRLAGLVTGDASGGRIAEFHLERPGLRIHFMAAAAVCCLVLSLQREICELVVECFPIEIDCICLAAFVVAVAVLALGAGDIAASAMKAALCLDVLVDVFVAVQTQTIL